MNQEPKKRSKRRHEGVRSFAFRALLVALVATSLAFFFGVGVWITLLYSVRVPDIRVPDLIDVDRVDAGRQLRELGLDPRITGHRPDPIKPEGRVLEQIPAPGASTRPGRAVRLVVSSGPKEVAFPALGGSSLRRAEIALKNSGFKVAAAASAPHPRIPVGRVISQHPVAGQAGFPGEGASLLLSAGGPVRSFVMPDVVGWPADRAARALERAGFSRVRVRAGGGVVTRQDPRPGHRVSIDYAIVLDARGSGIAMYPREGGRP